jgi:phage terminase Nu1 subunit (DNA packaging protein)
VADVAEFFGVHARTIAQWTDQGMPRVAAGSHRWRYDLSAISRWRIEQVGRRAPPPNPAIDEDLDIDVSSSPALEEYRKHRARIAKVEADKAEESVISRAAARESFGRFASIFRRLGQVLKVRYPEAHELLDDALVEARQSIAAILEGDADAEALAEDA